MLRRVSTIAIMAGLAAWLAGCAVMGGSAQSRTVAHTAGNGAIAAGDYVGYLDVPGMQLEMTIHLAQAADGSWSGTIDIPQQLTMGYELVDLVVDGQQLQMALESPIGRAEFSGDYDRGRAAILGLMTQNGVAFPFELEAFDAEAIKAGAAAKLAGLPAFVEQTLGGSHIPGVAIGVVSSGLTVHAAGYGLRDLEQQLPVTTGTLFSIGSVSKSFTATAVAMLHDDGLLDWDTPVTEYLPEFSLFDETATAIVTARDLCTHRTGLPANHVEGSGWSDSYATREQALAGLDAIEPTADVRTLFQYSNLGYLAAGVLAGEVSGSSWEEVVQARILSPLGMDSTLFTYEEMELSADHATGYDWAWGTDVAEPHFAVQPYNYDVVTLAPSGAIQSSLDDMLKYLKLHMGSGVVDGEQLISLEQLAMMHSPHIPIVSVHGQLPQIPMMDYGLGWMIFPYRGYYTVEHGGAIGGFSCSVLMLPDEELGVVVLTNAHESQAPLAIALYVCDLLLELDPESGSLALLELLKVGEEMQSNTSCC